MMGALLNLFLLIHSVILGCAVCVFAPVTVLA